LSENEITELAGRATESIHRNAGISPTAFRAPGGASTTYTRQLLRKLGYSIDASLTETGAISTAADGFACLPYQWVGVDATHWLWNKRECSEVETIWQSALLNAAYNNQHLIFIWHPHVMGVAPERLAIGESIIRFVQDDPRFEIFTLQALREHSLATMTADDGE
jgi:peptidoglycan/xylan/chitin deacetylase (PgdA/CDA1 family)